MNNTLLRSILVGLLLGVALFVMPFFLLRLIVFLVIIGALFRFVGLGRYQRRGWEFGRQYNYKLAFADRIRRMSDDEYNQFKQRHAPGERADNGGRKSSENPTSENPTNV